MLEKLAFPLAFTHGKLATMSIHEKIKAARLSRGWSMDKLAEEISASEALTKPLAWQTVQQWEAGKSAPRRQRMETVGRLLGLSASDLIADGDPWAGGIEMEGDPELISVRKVKLRLKAGTAGFAVDVDDGDGLPIFFRTDWLKERGLKPAHLVAIKVSGSSMEPTLFAGDTVVINTADNTPKDGRVSVLNYEGETVIKRMVRDNGSWWLSSDNPDQRRFARKECGDVSCLIVGRVVHRQSEQI